MLMVLGLMEHMVKFEALNSFLALKAFICSGEDLFVVATNRFVVVCSYCKQVVQ